MAREERGHQGLGSAIQQQRESQLSSPRSPGWFYPDREECGEGISGKIPVDFADSKIKGFPSSFIIFKGLFSLYFLEFID